MRQPELLDCTGTYPEMGMIQGRWAEPKIKAIFEMLLKTEYIPFWLRRYGNATVMKIIFSVLGLKHYRGLLKKIDAHVPEQAARLRGIAKTSSLPLSALLAINEIEIIATQIQYVCGCSALGFHPSRLARARGPVLAYNHDFPPFFEEFVFLRRTRPQGAYSSLVLTYPVLSGAMAGLNDKGLAASLNHAFADETPRVGVPITMLVQEVLDKTATIAEALALLQDKRPACGSILTLVDKDGDMAAVELSCSRTVVRRPKDGILMSVNQYETQEMQAIEVPQDAVFDPKKFPPIFHSLPIHNVNWSRSKRFKDLLGRKRVFEASDLKAMLRDHDKDEQPCQLTICRHHETAKTLASTLIHPAEGRMEITAGNPCQGLYKMYAIDG